MKQIEGEDKIYLQESENIRIIFDTHGQKIAWVKRKVKECEKDLKHWLKILAKIQKEKNNESDRQSDI